MLRPNISEDPLHVPALELTGRNHNLNFPNSIAHHRQSKYLFQKTERSPLLNKCDNQIKLGRVTRHNRNQEHIRILIWWQASEMLLYQIGEDNRHLDILDSIVDDCNFYLKGILLSRQNFF